MELVPGSPLSSIIEREGTLPPDRALNFIAQTARALAAAHSQGLAVSYTHLDVYKRQCLTRPYIKYSLQFELCPTFKLPNEARELHNEMTNRAHFDRAPRI